MSSRKKKKIWLVPVCAAVIAVAAGGLLIWNTLKEPESEQTAADAGGGNSEEGSSSSDTVVWQGKEYEYNDHLSNYLFMGIDTRETAETSMGQANAGQADAIYLAVWDRQKDSVTLISIPRDTMTQIEVFGPEGDSLGKTEDHISLSYAYGDGNHESCRLTEEAVSDLFYGLPIQGYCSINMDGIPVLSESVGGVTVTVPNDSLEETYPEFAEGAQVTLDAENTETFVRYRDTEVSQSALDRMERQKEYIRAFGEAAQTKISENTGFITELYTTLEPYMVTNMGSDQFAQIMESVSSGSVSEGWTVPGEGTEGKSFDEYRVDDDALYEMIIDTFYIETEQ